MENELKRYGTILWHWAWLIVLGALLGAGVAYLSSRLTTPVYAASTTLLVNEAPSSGTTTDYASILTSERLARTYSEMMTKQPVLKEVVKTLNLPDTKVDHLGHINVNLVPDTQLIVLQIEDESPQLAANLANTIPMIFSRQNAELQAERYADSKANLSKELEALKQQISQLQNQIDVIGKPETPAQDAELSRLQAEMTQLRQSLTYLLQSFENIRLAEAQSTSNIAIIEPATVPTIPVRPRTLPNTLLGGLIGLMIAVGVVFLIEYLDDRVRSPEQIDRLLKLPVVGLIAKMNDSAQNGKSRLIAVREPRSPVTEAFRVLRTNIQFAGVDHAIRTLLVTSAGPTEGKSTIAANLAVVMAQAGLKVALVDGDLRRPTIHKLFNVSNHSGLTDVMLAESNFGSTWLQSSDVSGLLLVPSGPLPPNPSELLGTKRMQQFLDYLHGQVDTVIIDTPPLLPVTDALVLAPKADGVLLVIDYGSTRIGEALQGRNQLNQSGARIVGIAMNKIPTGRRGYSYYDYRRYYAYEHTEEGKRRRFRLSGSSKAGGASTASSVPMSADSTPK